MPDAPDGVPTCPRCGFTEKDLSRTTFLGCPHCYDAFEFQLLTMLLQMHPGEIHRGKKLVLPNHRFSTRRSPVWTILPEMEHTNNRVIYCCLEGSRGQPG